MSFFYKELEFKSTARAFDLVSSEFYVQA